MTLGEKLRALRMRAGVSIRAAAADAGMKSPSNWQHYESPDFAGTSLPADYTIRLATIWAGMGDPAITLEDVLALSPEVAKFVSATGTSFSGTLKRNSSDISVRIEIETSTLENFSKLTDAINHALKASLAKHSSV